MAFNILLVDDSMVALNIMKKVISISGLPIKNIFTAQNGKLALEELKKHKIDIILTDLNMPVMDGFTFLTEIKKISILSKIPVVIVSTEGRDQYIIKGIKLGAVNYIRKPFKPEQVKDVIVKTLGVEIDESKIEFAEESDF